MSAVAVSKLCVLFWMELVFVGMLYARLESESQVCVWCLIAWQAGRQAVCDVIALTSMVRRAAQAA